MHHFEEAGFLQRIIDDMISKDGWAVVYRSLDHSAYMDIRTVGLPQSFSHCNLQITACVHIPIAVYIFRHFVDQIKKNIPLRLDHTYTGILQNNIKLKQYDLGEEKVYRIIIADRKGRYPDDPDCDVDFKFQEHNLKLLYVLHPRNS